MKKYIKFIALGVIIAIIAELIGLGGIESWKWWLFVIPCNLIGNIILVSITESRDKP